MKHKFLYLPTKPGYRVYKAIDNKMASSKYAEDYTAGKAAGFNFVNNLFSFRKNKKEKTKDIPKQPMAPMKPNRQQRRGNNVFAKKNRA